MRKFNIFLLGCMIILFAGCGGDNGTDGDGEKPKPIRLVVDTQAVPSPADVNVGWTSVDSVLVEIGGSSLYGINNNLGKQNVTVKAIKRSDTLFLRVKWHDATANIWGRYLDKSSYGMDWDSATYEGEDKFFVLMGTQNTDTMGANCAALCHATTHYTASGKTADVWKWMATTTAPGFMAEDEWWTSSGRSLDATALNTFVYRRNWNSLNQYPYWMHETGVAFDGPFLYLEDTATFNPSLAWDTLTSRLPGYAIDSTIRNSATRGQSSRWDVAAISEYDSSGASYSEFTWTVVFSRALNTGHAEDINLGTLDSVQVSIAATNDDYAEWNIAHSGSKPFWIILQ